MNRKGIITEVALLIGFGGLLAGAAIYTGVRHLVHRHPSTTITRPHSHPNFEKKREIRPAVPEDSK